MNLNRNETIHDNSTGYSAAIHWLSIALVSVTVVLLIVGALVTSNDAGDSVPDWPMSFGRWLIRGEHFTGNVRYEYSHRVVAGVVGIVTGVLAITIWLTPRARRIRWLGLAAFATVVLQALLGGLRVLFPGSKPLIAVPHALVAQSFLCIGAAIALLSSRSWLNRTESVIAETSWLSVRRLAIAGVVVVMIQLVLGAAFRHGAAGIEPHIAGAVVVTAVVGATVVRALKTSGRDSYLKRPAIAASVLLVIQIALGVLAYLARLASADAPQPVEPMISLTVAHVVVGALTLISVLSLAMRALQVLRPLQSSATAVVGAPREAGA
ncbi:MAG TPA: COX15/CtaA family protein [Blastocatellia bacterium]|nr:COX15/CtaA family protein [Blastocatellia bacterium]